MRKGFLIVLAVVLVAALAAPAMAGMRPDSGFFRVKGYMSNFKNGAAAPVLENETPRQRRTSRSASARNSRSARRT